MPGRMKLKIKFFHCCFLLWHKTLIKLKALVSCACVRMHIWVQKSVKHKDICHSDQDSSKKDLFHTLSQIFKAGLIDKWSLWRLFSLGYFQCFYSNLLLLSASIVLKKKWNIVCWNLHIFTYHSIRFFKKAYYEVA